MHLGWCRPWPGGWRARRRGRRRGWRGRCRARRWHGGDLAVEGGAGACGVGEEVEQALVEAGERAGCPPAPVCAVGGRDTCCVVLELADAAGDAGEDLAENGALRRGYCVDAGIRSGVVPGDDAMGVLERGHVAQGAGDVPFSVAESGLVAEVPGAADLGRVHGPGGCTGAAEQVQGWLAEVAVADDGAWVPARRGAGGEGACAPDEGCGQQDGGGEPEEGGADPQLGAGVVVADGGRGDRSGDQPFELTRPGDGDDGDVAGEEPALAFGEGGVCDAGAARLRVVHRLPSSVWLGLPPGTASAYRG
jgi:hypothetical protein